MNSSPETPQPFDIQPFMIYTDQLLRRSITDIDNPENKPFINRMNQFALTFALHNYPDYPDIPSIGEQSNTSTPLNPIAMEITTAIARLDKQQLSQDEKAEIERLVHDLSTMGKTEVIKVIQQLGLLDFQSPVMLLENIIADSLSQEKQIALAANFL